MAGLKKLLVAKAVDPTLDALFAASVGPVDPKAKPKYVALVPSQAKPSEAEEDGEDDDEDMDGSDLTFAAKRAADKSRKRKRHAEEGDELEAKYLEKLTHETASRDKKVKKAKASEKSDGEQERGQDGEQERGQDDDSEEDEEDEDDNAAPVHESLLKSGGANGDAVLDAETEREKEKAARTVFLSNVSIEAVTSKSAKKKLMAHLASVLVAPAKDSKPAAAGTEAEEGEEGEEEAEEGKEEVEEGKEEAEAIDSAEEAEAPAAAKAKAAETKDKAATTPLVEGTIESLRFRSVPFASAALPKRAAYITKAVMGATAQSTNAYVVYSSAAAARQAVRHLNGTVVLGRHLRTDSVAHPAPIDHRRCVFVGNLGFVDDEVVVEDPKKAQSAADTGLRKRRKSPMDVEEGLWRTFGEHAGRVESVRVIRDQATRVGKGIAYVQFYDANAVEAALLLAGKAFPPQLPRELRVSRCKAPHKTARALERAQHKGKGGPTDDKNKRHDRRKRADAGQYRPKVTPEQQTQAGRAAKLMGKAAVGKAVGGGRSGRDGRGGGRGGAPGAGAAAGGDRRVFEGVRARPGQGGGGVASKKRKGGGGGGGKDASNNQKRQRQRAATWRDKKATAGEAQ